MKQNKLKQLATLGICCSLLVNSLIGITATAETLTSESNQTDGTAVEPATNTGTTETGGKEESKDLQAIKENDSEAQKILKEDSQENTTQQSETTSSISESDNWKQITEKFIDEKGTAITPPTGFTQNQKVPITDNNFIFTESRTLPETYAADGKNYVFKGWYKGTNQTKMETTPKPSYAVTYNDQDDLTVVYEEAVTKTYTFPTKEIQFGYVDEAGNLLNPADFTVEAELGENDETQATVLSKVYGTDVAETKLKKLTIPGKSYELPDMSVKTYGTRYVNHTIPRYYRLMAITPTATYTGDKTKYPVPNAVRQNIENTQVISTTPGTESYYLSTNGIVFGTRRNYWSWDTTKTSYAMGIYSGIAGENYNLSSPSGTIYYYLENRRVTENFVDASGTKIMPPTGFIQGKKTVIDTDNFVYTSDKALPDLYTSGGKTYKFKGWYKGTDQTNLETTKTPSYAITYNNKDDLTVVYEEVQPTATLTVDRLYEVIDNGNSMDWTTKLTNTSEATLTNIKLAPTANWDSGILYPSQLSVKVNDGSYKNISVTAEQWQAGVDLDIEIPAKGEATIQLSTEKITGNPNQVLTAEMTATGNFTAVTASNFVRIQGEDQIITPTPTEEGFISTPEFDFGSAAISTSTQQYGLKKADDYYANGTRNPYLRLKKSQPDWSLTAQFSQPISANNQLSNNTRLLLGTANVLEIESYNQSVETMNKVGTTANLTLVADGTATNVIANKQFTGSDIFQLDFDFSDIKLEVPANQGKVNENYQGIVTWNLVTGP